MLPLWILDITKQSVRRDEFQSLVRQIEHVFIRPTDDDEDDIDLRDLDLSGLDEEDLRELGLVDDTTQEVETEDSDNSTPDLMETYGDEFDEESDEDTPRVSVTDTKTIEEQLEEEDKKKAAKKAIITGNYWYYSNLSYEDYFSDINIDDSNQIESIGNRLYDFQEAVVNQAKDFINEMRNSNIRPYQTINIVVLGDITEELTQLVFASIAALLQKEKGRFLPGHIHQGMCVFGMLFVPCDINTRQVDERAKMLKLFNEIEVQHRISAIRGYDYMLLYQDVQNRTECSYPRLNEKQQAEYLLQCMVHLFLACDVNHPLIHGTGSDDTFYLSMGATSVFFDMTYEDKNDANRVAYDIINTFKEEGDNAKPDRDFQLVNKELFLVENFVKQVNVERFDVDEVEDKTFNPHPIKDFFHRNLKRLYYQYQLRFYPAELLRSIMQRIDEATSNQLDEISAYCSNSFKAAEIGIPSSIANVLSKVNEHGGALTSIEYLFKNLQEQMSKEKAEIQRAIENGYWQKIMYKIPLIPSDEIDHFEEYHDAYVNDVKSKNDGAGCDNMKQTIMSKLKSLLSKEKTVLATLSRSFFLGILSVLGILPVLDFLSPGFINLGDVHRHAFPWAVGLFLLPLFIQFISLLLYLRKRANCVRVLKAYYKHDAYSRVANRIEFEALEFYDKMIALCEEYLNRCQRIRKEVSIATPNPEAKTVFPISMFNQPLNGGHFGNDYLIPTSEVEGCRIRVNYMPRFVNELTREMYFMLINRFNGQLSVLFKDVGITEHHARRFDDTLGDYVFVSHDELLKIKEKNWENIKLEFTRQLMNGIKGEMIPREHPTVGEKLIQYKRKIDKLDLLEPMIAYAATNGEIISESDTEFADVKVNLDIDDLVTSYLPLYTTRLQTEKHDELYKKLIFVTRWRCFDHFNFNRMLPKEDFDEEMRRQRIYEEEMKAKKKMAREGQKKQDLKEEEESVNRQDEKGISTSSLILWAICPDDNSSEWLKLFEAERFSESYKYRNTFRSILNKND